MFVGNMIPDDTEIHSPLRLRNTSGRWMGKKKSFVTDDDNRRDNSQTDRIMHPPPLSSMMNGYVKTNNNEIPPVKHKKTIVKDCDVRKKKFDTMPSRNSTYMNNYADHRDDTYNFGSTTRVVRRQRENGRVELLNTVGSFDDKTKEINFPTEETKRKSSSLPKSFQRNDVIRKEFKYRDK